LRPLVSELKRIKRKGIYRRLDFFGGAELLLILKQSDFVDIKYYRDTCREHCSKNTGKLEQKTSGSSMKMRAYLLCA
jgi:hypothetical protein